jgi:uncharacterized membrane protein (UPF0136 family)
MAKLVLGVLIAAAVTTASDYTWYEMGVANRMIAGIITGVVMLTAAGGALGWAAGQVRNGLVLGLVAGLIGALSYYAMQPTLGGRPAMFAAWASLWIILAIGEGRFLRSPRRPWNDVLVRAAIAGALSTVAFYAIASTLWGPPPAGGRNYALQFVRWVIVYAPGIIAIARPAARR